MTDKIPVASALIFKVPGIQKNSRYSFMEISFSRFSPILTKLYSMSSSLADSFLNGIQNFWVPPTYFKAIGINRYPAHESNTDLGLTRRGGSITPINITYIHFFFSNSSKVYVSLYLDLHTLSSYYSSTSESSKFKNETIGFFFTLDGAHKTIMNSYSHFGPNFRVIFLVNSLLVGFSMNQQSCYVSEFTINQFLWLLAFFFRNFSYLTTSSLFTGSSLSSFIFYSSMHSFKYLKS